MQNKSKEEAIKEFVEELTIHSAEMIHEFEKNFGNLVAFDVVLDVDYGRELKFSLGVKDGQD
jgi:hypothetical protein